MRNKYAKVSDPNSFHTDPGSPVKILYSPIVLPNGEVEIKESGKVDLQEKYNSQLEKTDMSWILNQIALGNTDVINQGQPLYGDFTDMPKSYAEVLQLYIDGQRSFDALSTDIKSKFDNDFMKWFASAGTPDWIDKMGIVQDAIKEDKPVVETAAE